MHIYLTARDPNVGAGLPAMAASQPTPIHLTPRDPNVGAGLPAMAASQPTPIHLTPHNPTVCGLAREGGLAGDTVGLCTYPFLR
ncbi:hypothetical protein DXU77_07385 [Pseudomonas lactis]|nr:hypothetical protein [Pseudomonas lactis]